MSGASRKYPWNFSASSVADITTTLRSSRFSSTSLRRPNSTSVASVRSCASSMTMTLYRDSSGSVMASRRSIPSVEYFMNVFGPVASSKRME